VTKENIDFMENWFEIPNDLEMESKIVKIGGIAYIQQYNVQTTSRLDFFQKNQKQW